MIDVYCDGGVIQVNPSPIGGTWAYVIVDQDGVEVRRAFGVVTPAEIGMPAVTNNFTEFFAALQAFYFLPKGWAGRLHTDSNVTRLRLIYPNAKMNGIPNPWQELLRYFRSHLGGFNVTLLDGHPTKAQLEKGVGKRGNPVSKWNVLCDKLCTEAGRAFTTMEVAQ
jgi:ribonuclease HI